MQLDLNFLRLYSNIKANVCLMLFITKPRMNYADTVFLPTLMC